MCDRYAANHICYATSIPVNNIVICCGALCSDELFIGICKKSLQNNLVDATFGDSNSNQNEKRPESTALSRHVTGKCNRITLFMLFVWHHE